MNEIEYRRIKSIIVNKESERDLLKKQLADLKKKSKADRHKSGFLKKAQILIQLVAQKTQTNLKYHICNLVTTALKSISSEYPKFAIDIESRRNQTEIDMSFEENEIKQDPLASSGFGAVNIACYALIMAIWCLNKNRPFFAADEPFRDLSEDKTHKASSMLKMMCEKLGMQQLIVSHDRDIGNYANRIFHVVRKDMQSTVKTINGLPLKEEPNGLPEKQNDNGKEIKTTQRRKRTTTPRRRTR